MVRAQDVTAVARSVLVGVLTVAVLVGCAQHGCGAGASTATDAMRGVLTGLVTGSEDAICQFVPEGLTEKARGSLAELSAEVVRAGGVGSVEIVEAVGRQMGSEHVVQVISGQAVLADVVVIEQDGAFLVLPGVEPAV